MIKLCKLINEKGQVSYCLNSYNFKTQESVNVYISYAEYCILKETFEKLGYKVDVKDFRKVA